MTRDNPTLRLNFDDRWFDIDPTVPFVIGREGDLAFEDNPYLHRRFLEIGFDRFWVLSNLGSRLSATISGAEDEGVHAWLGPDASLPLVMRTTNVRFTAGPVTYRLVLVLSKPLLTASPNNESSRSSHTTLMPVELTDLQRQLVLSLAEPMLRDPRRDMTIVPASADAARRLGWTITRFNRQLDAVCTKLARAGVEGLQGEIGNNASNRRSRLVEYSLATQLVSVADLDRLPPI